MQGKINFGAIGIGIGESIVFIASGEQFMVASGDGTQENGGTLLAYPNGSGKGLFGLEYTTKK